MQLKSTSIFQTILFYFLFVPFLSNASSFQENPLTKAIQLFDKEKYAEAEVLFKNLLDKRIDDFMVNYFYGACRTENGHYSDQDLNYLIKASKEVNPLNIDYYFGVQYHAKNQWEKALVYYKLYKNATSVNDQEKVNLDQKIDQCNNKINPFITSEVEEKPEISEAAVIPATTIAAVSVENIEPKETKPEVAMPIPVDTAITEPVETANPVILEQALLVENDSTVVIVEPVQDTMAKQRADEIPKVELLKSEPVEEVINFNVNNEITYIFLSNFKTEEGKIYFKEGTLKQTELNEVVKETENLREKYKLSKLRSEKDSIGQQILALESQTYELKGVVNQMFVQVKTAENGYWQNATPEETERFIVELNTAIELNKKNIINTEPEIVTSELIISPVLVEKEEVKSEKPITKTSGIIYKIQIGAYSKGIPNNQKQAFNKISVIRKVENYTDANGVVVYTTGNLTNYDDAVLMQNQVRQEGIKDPIIAAYLNGKRITLEQAKETEKQK